MASTGIRVRYSGTWKERVETYCLVSLTYWSLSMFLLASDSDWRKGVCLATWMRDAAEIEMVGLPVLVHFSHAYC